MMTQSTTVCKGWQLQQRSNYVETPNRLLETTSLHNQLFVPLLTGVSSLFQTTNVRWLDFGKRPPAMLLHI